MEHRVISRTEAIRVLDRMQKKALGPDYLEDDLTDYSEYSNDALEAEVCLSGYVDEAELGAVVDDADLKKN
jgi:hypothetical protein